MAKVTAFECDGPKCFTLGRKGKTAAPDGWAILTLNGATKYFHSLECLAAGVHAMRPSPTGGTTAQSTQKIQDPYGAVPST